MAPKQGDLMATYRKKNKKLIHMTDNIYALVGKKHMADLYVYGEDEQRYQLNHMAIKDTINQLVAKQDYDTANEVLDTLMDISQE